MQKGKAPAESKCVLSLLHKGYGAALLMAILVGALAGGIIALTICTGIGVNIMLPDQYTGIAVTGQMYSGEYAQRGLDKPTLGNVPGGGAAVTSPLVPRNTCGSCMSSILGVSALQYAPFAFFNCLLPVVMIVWGFFFAGRTKKAD